MKLPLPGPDLAADGPCFDLGEPPHNLRYPDRLFSGRGRELVRISDWMADGRHHRIVLTGLGGSGKSNLAHAAALRNSWRFRGIFHLGARERPVTVEEIGRVVESVLGLGSSLSELPPAVRRQRLLEMFRDHHYLLILDNLEGIASDQAAELASFLHDFDPRSGSMALLTLRPGSLMPLVDPTKGNYYHLPVDGLGPDEAVVLLGQLLRPALQRNPSPEERTVLAKVPVQAITSAGDSSVHLLAVRCQMDPKTIPALQEMAEAAYHNVSLLRLAVARLRAPGSDWDTVRDHVRNLRGADVQEKVQAMVGDVCDDLARRQPGALALLQALLVFVDGATADALRFVWHGGPVAAGSPEAERFVDLCREAGLASLLDRSDDRLDLPPLVRQYLDLRLTPDQRRRLTAAHRAYFLTYAREHARDHEALERDRLNLFAALDGVPADDLSTRVDLPLYLFSFLAARGFFREGRHWVTRGLEASGRLPEAAPRRMLLQLALGVLCKRQADYGEGQKALEAALQLAEELDDHRVLAEVLRELGNLFVTQGALSRARPLLERVEKLRPDEVDPVGRAAVLFTRGLLERIDGNHEAAKNLYLPSLALAEQVNNPYLLALNLLGLDQCGLSPDERAAVSRCAALIPGLAERLPRGALKAATLHVLGVWQTGQGNRELAEGYFHESLALSEEVGDQSGRAETLRELGDLFAGQKRSEQARAYLSASLALQQEIGDKGGEARALHSQAGLAFREGNIGLAEQLYRRGLDLARETGNVYWETRSWMELARCARKRDDEKGAQEHEGRAAVLMPCGLMRYIYVCDLNRFEHELRRLNLAGDKEGPVLE